MAPDLHATATSRLRRDGQRYTTGRRALVNVLEAAEHPLSIPQLLGEAPSLAQSSAYRNLAVLERAGVVHRIVTSDDHARYELAEDLTEHHHHLICSLCGTVRDFTVEAGVERTLDKAVSKVADNTGYTIEHHRFDLVGLCPDCK